MEETTPKRRRKVDADPLDPGATRPVEPVEVASVPVAAQTTEPAPAPADTAPAVTASPEGPPSQRKHKVRVLKNLFHDGTRFRARGEVVQLSERQIQTAGSAVERL
jgi:hypothetical protein